MKIHTLDITFQNLNHTIAVFALESAEGLALVETGPYSSYPQLLATLAAKGWSPADFRYVFLSHIHFDHAGAAWALAQHGAKIYVHPRGLPHLANPGKLYQSARMIYGDAMDTLWGAMEPIPEEQLYAPQHGETIDVAGLHLTAWHTPGHAVHHIAWELAQPDESAVLFTGDVAGICIDGQLVVPPCPPPDINLEDWRQSLQLIRELPVSTLYLTHYGPVANKNAHLDALEARLQQWAAWMKPFAENQTPAPEVVPAFESFVRAELLAAGLDATGLARYEAANPAYMSVAGLLRYWNKKLAR
ncbi:MAG: MBL fold metallo-hydrolase [Saprospirales bacterium]|nr:MBL fold metallo-hydrolase [Saprospirales bacterium]MBK8920375.1 MBL fold metallo-hydrolase [Saprospirales bacterium]